MSATTQEKVLWQDDFNRVLYREVCYVFETRDGRTSEWRAPNWDETQDIYKLMAFDLLGGEMRRLGADKGRERIDGGKDV